jgi:hypothetical protein
MVPVQPVKNAAAAIVLQVFMRSPLPRWFVTKTKAGSGASLTEVTHCQYLVCPQQGIAPGSGVFFVALLFDPGVSFRRMPVFSIVTAVLC